MKLHNDTVVNVATLLQDPVGSHRAYSLHLDAFGLDEDLQAVELDGELRLTRLRDEIVAHVRVAGVIDLDCQRCLRAYAQPFDASFDEEFRASVDVKTGAEIDVPVEDERFTINEKHELDIAEPLRQEILVSLPMRPACGPDCPGPDVLEVGEPDESDSRFAALAMLLEAERADEHENGTNLNGRAS